MTVFVDNMHRPAQLSGRPAKWSHLLADTTDELVDFARRLGLKDDWIQKPGTCHEHYDVTAEVRSLALRLGARRIIYPHDTGRFVADKRAKGKYQREVRVAKATAALWQADSNLRRDRWGYELRLPELEAFARYALDQPAGLTMAELTDTIICGMLTDAAPLICQEADYPAQDDHIETLVRIILDAAGLPHPEPGVREVH